MPSAYGGKFDKAIRKLRSSGLVPPFKVRTVPASKIKGLYGYYHIPSGTIYIARGMTQAVAIDTLLHECSHAADLADGREARKDHPNTWGVTYARLYQFFFDSKDAA